MSDREGFDVYVTDATRGAVRAYLERQAHAHAQVRWCESCAFEDRSVIRVAAPTLVAQAMRAELRTMGVSV